MTASAPSCPARPICPGGSTRRFLLSGSAAALPLAVGLAGCGTAQSSQPAATVPPAKVSWFVYSFNARQNEIFDSTVRQAFEKEHPGYQLEVSAGGGVDKLITLATSGPAPDLEWYGSPVLWTQGLLRRLNDLMARDKIDTKVFSPATFRSWNMVRDAVISLPVQTGGNWPVVPYNRDFFTRAGVPEPPAK